MKKLFLGFMLIFFASCSAATPSPEDLKTISYMPTQCSEPWDEATYTNSGANRGSRLLAYLKDKGIVDIYNFKSTTDDKFYCEACTCLSGELFTFSVAEADYNKLKTIEPFKSALN